MCQILLVANRKTTIDSLRQIINTSQFQLLAARNQRSALKLARRHAPDLILIDNTSAKLSGPCLAQALRRILDVPIIAIVKAQSEAAGMNAVDYLVKPYTARELVDCTRRALDYPRELVVGPLRLDLRTRSIQIPHRDEPHPLTPKLFAILRLLMRHRGTIVSREMLMAEVWNTRFLADTRTLDVHIRWIRQIIEQDPSKPRFLRTIRGKGYCLDDSPA